MTNVLPPHAKKQITVEYWVRVVCAWVVVWSVFLMIGAVLLWPTYVLLSGKTAAYGDFASRTEERTIEYNQLAQQLVTATQQSQYVVQLSQREKLSGVLDDVWRAAGAHPVDVSFVSLTKSDGVLPSFTVGGEAIDRLALAGFRNELLSLPYVSDVTLPFSDLAESQDISFTLVVTLTPPTS